MSAASNFPKTWNECTVIRENHKVIPLDRLKFGPQYKADSLIKSWNHLSETISLGSL